MPETSGSGMISEDENYFEITITADKARFTFQPPTSTPMIIRPLFRSFKRSMVIKHYDHGFETCDLFKDYIL